MLRAAAPADVAAIARLRDRRGDDRLSDAARATDGDLARLIAGGAVWVWEEGGAVLGFAAAERRDGSIPGLLVAPGHDGKGIGRALLAAACDFLRAAGCAAARIAVDPGSAAARHYRDSGWSPAGESENRGAVFEKPL